MCIRDRRQAPWFLEKRPKKNLWNQAAIRFCQNFVGPRSQLGKESYLRGQTKVRLSASVSSRLETTHFSGEISSVCSNPTPTVRPTLLRRPAGTCVAVWSNPQEDRKIAKPKAKITESNFIRVNPYSLLPQFVKPAFFILGNSCGLRSA